MTVEGEKRARLVSVVLADNYLALASQSIEQNPAVFAELVAQAYAPGVRGRTLAQAQAYATQPGKSGVVLSVTSIISPVTSFLPLLVGLHWPSLPWGNESLDAPLSFGDDPTTTIVDAYAK